MEASPYGYLPLGTTSLKRTSYDFQDYSTKPVEKMTEPLTTTVSSTGNSKSVWLAVIISVSIIVLLIIAIIIVIVVNSKKNSNHSETDIIISKKKDVLKPDMMFDSTEDDVELPVMIPRGNKIHSGPRDLEQVYQEIERQDHERYSPDDNNHTRRRVRFAEPEVNGSFESPGKIMKFRPLGDQSGFATL